MWPQIRRCTNSHTRPLSDQTGPPKSTHQIRPLPPHQTSRSHWPYRVPSLTAPLQISTAHTTSWNGTSHVHCLWVGSRRGGGGGIWSSGWTLQSILSKRSAWRFRTSFRFNLTVVRSVSCVPWVDQGLPCPFSEVGFLCRCSISDIISALRFSLASRKRFGFVFLHLFQMD